MDSSSVLILRSVTTAQAFLAVSGNILVILMVIFKSPRGFQNFATLVLISCAMQTTSCFLGWMTVNQVAGVTKNGTIVFVIYGLSSVFGPKFAFVLDQFTFPIGMMYLYLIPFSMGYRFYIVNFDSLRRRILLLWVFVVCCPFLWILVSGYTSLS